MVTSNEENTENTEVVETTSEESIPTTSRRSSNTPSYDFKQDIDSPDLSIYTVNTKIDSVWKKYTIVATNYGIALELAGLQKATTIKESSEPFDDGSGE
ncbi:hypothetical protein [uncultured Mediterranean phage]|nr:hypothetical protein [uncultured Mediterranean phage]